MIFFKREKNLQTRNIEIKSTNNTEYAMQGSAVSFYISVCNSVEDFPFLRHIKLQGVLDGLEGSVPDGSACHLPVCRGPDRVLEPGLLVGVVAP